MSMMPRPTILAALALVAAAAGAPVAFAATDPLDTSDNRYQEPLEGNGFVSVGWKVQPDDDLGCSGDLVITLEYLGGEYGPDGDGDQYYLCTGTGDDAGLWKESNTYKHLQSRGSFLPLDTDCQASPGACTPSPSSPGLP